MTRPFHAMLFIGGGVAIALAAHAAVPIQLRVTVSPDKGQAAWDKPGILFQKTGECVYSTTANLPATWPVTSGVVGSGKATAPLFNPGFATPDGYMPGTVDDGFNTIFLPLEGGAGAKTVVCRGTILANGKDVTAATSGRVVSRTVEAISNGGPPTVTVTLDAGKLAGVPVRAVRGGSGPTLPSAAITPTVLRKGTFTITLSGGKDAVDLETGMLMSRSGAIPAGAGPHDLWVGWAGSYASGFVRLSPGALFAADLGGSPTARGYHGCKGGDFVSGNMELPLIQHFCIRTAEGHLAEVIVGTSKYGSPYASGSYTVWN